MKGYLAFLAVSYVTALVFETIANTIGDGTLFQNTWWPLFFLGWYGLIYSATFLIFYKRALWQPVLVWAILGPVVEYFIFLRLNIIVDSIIYALMFFVPFWIYHKYITKKFKSEIEIATP
nr:hypothetical protein [Candidatus Freyarchaeota archaeon]